MFNKGQNVTQIVPAPITGTVAGFSLDQENGEVLVLVNFTNEAGEEQTRYFQQSQLAVTPTAPTEA